MCGQRRLRDMAKGVSLNEHFDRILDERDKRYNQRFDDQSLAVATALAAAEKAVNAAMAAAEKAVSKAETSTDKRLEAVNEFRQTLSDQQSTFVRQDVADARFKALENQLAESRGRGAGLNAMFGYILAVLAAIIGVAEYFHR